jgi:hypothetical protein
MVRENKIILHGEYPRLHKDASMSRPPRTVAEELLSECNHYAIILLLNGNLVEVHLLINMTLCCFQSDDAIDPAIMKNQQTMLNSPSCSLAVSGRTVNNEHAAFGTTG